MIMRGQMAVAVNQVGYDVVLAEGDKISVKTFTTSTRVDFKARTLHYATRVMVLQILIEEGEPSIREALDCSIEELRPMLRDVGGQLYLPVNRIRAATEALPRNLADLQVVASASWRNLQIVRLENGTILVKDEGGTLPQALPLPRQIAHAINIDGANALGRHVKNVLPELPLLQPRVMVLVREQVWARDGIGIVLGQASLLKDSGCLPIRLLMQHPCPERTGGMPYPACPLQSASRRDARNQYIAKAGNRISKPTAMICSPMKGSRARKISPREMSGGVTDFR